MTMTMTSASEVALPSELTTHATQAGPELQLLIGGLAAGSELTASVHQAVVVQTMAGEYWLGGREVIMPVRAELEVDAAEVVASEPHTGIFGAGPDLASALTDLREALVDHLAVLEDSEPLSEQLIEQRDWLRRHIHPDA